MAATVYKSPTYAPGIGTCQHLFPAGNVTHTPNFQIITFPLPYHNSRCAYGAQTTMGTPVLAGGVPIGINVRRMAAPQLPPGPEPRKGYRNGITLVLNAADRAVRPAAGIPWPPPLQTTFARQGSSQTGLVTRESIFGARSLNLGSILSVHRSGGSVTWLSDDMIL